MALLGDVYGHVSAPRQPEPHGHLLVLEPKTARCLVEFPVRTLNTYVLPAPILELACTLAFARPSNIVPGDWLPNALFSFHCQTILNKTQSSSCRNLNTR